jgi:hypothetical protein
MKSNRKPTILNLLPLITLLSTAAAHAQHPLTNDSVHEDISHDSLANDPSDPRRVMRLKKMIPQQDFAVNETIYRGLIPSLDLNSIIDSWSNPSFDEIVSERKSMFRFFKIHADRRVPQLQNGPTTVNADHEYAGISDRQFGYCWGYATMVRFFTHVAFFDGSLKRPPLKETIAEVDQVLKGKATLIRGYSNFRELSLNPKVEFHLKLAAMELWRARAVRASSVGITLKSTTWMTFQEVESLAQNLEMRLKRGEFPKLVFSSLIPTNPFFGMNTDIHVVPAYRVERLSNKRIRIHLWDINFYAETLQKSPKWLEIDSNHHITYAPYLEEGKPYSYGSDIIGRVTIAPENDDENATMLNSLREFCSNTQTKKYCKK